MIFLILPVRPKIPRMQEFRFSWLFHKTSQAIDQYLCDLTELKIR